MELLDLFWVSEVRILPESGAQLRDEMVVGIGIIASKTMKLASLIISIHTSLNKAMDRKRSGFPRGSIAQVRNPVSRVWTSSQTASPAWLNGEASG